MQKVEELIDEGFEDSPQARNIVSQIAIHHNLSKRYLTLVPKNDKCFVSFIRSIVTNIIQWPQDDHSFKILSEFVPDDYQYELKRLLETKLVRTDCRLVKFICAKVIDTIYDKWDYDQPIYTTESINYDLVYDMVMRLLGTNLIKIYLLNPKLPLEQTSKILIPTKPLFCDIEKEYKIEMICLRDYCHYDLLA
jgi:hypothetical protein